jgi:hypothetical protein
LTNRPKYDILVVFTQERNTPHMSPNEDGSNPLSVGQIVTYPRWDVSNGVILKGTVDGRAVVTEIISSEHVRLGNDDGAWNIWWLEPEDEFLQWVMEVRADASVL